MTTIPTDTVPARAFLPLADSPLLTGAAGRRAAAADLAVRLAEHAAADPATVASLLSITHQPTADRITAALDARDDLPTASLTLLIAHRPQVRAATARLKDVLFPSGDGACHTFTRTVAALAHRPETLDSVFLSSDRFTRGAAAADPAALTALLAPLLTAPALPGPTDAALGLLLDARRAAGAVSAFDRDGTTARERTRRYRITAELLARRAQTIRDVADHTGGLTRAAELWYDELLASATTPQLAAEALAWAVLAGQLLTTGQDPGTSWPAARARWDQAGAAARAARRHPDLWETAWQETAATDDGSAWDPVQRGLVTGYDLMVRHVRDTCPATDPVPTPGQFWATDPTGRALLHTVADHLTGHHGHSPLDHFTDTQLITFIRALSKTRRDTRLPGALHLHGLIAAVKAARSKTILLTRPATVNLGIVIPTRREAARIASSAAGGDDALTAKTAQLAWLLECRPDARAHLLLVDEDPDGASARSAAEHPPAGHPQIHLTLATRPDPDSTKGGALAWGLAQLRGAGPTTLAFTDLDLTYPLDQTGLLLGALDQPGTAAAIASRRLPDSHGYYPPAGPPPTTRLYQQAVHELLGLTAADPQAGFKVFDPAALDQVLPHVADRRLTFDTDLLTALQRAGHTVTEAGVAALHRWHDGTAGTPRDYDVMLTAVHDQALRHGLNPSNRATPVWDTIRNAGSLAAAAGSQPPIALPLTDR